MRGEVKELDACCKSKNKIVLIAVLLYLLCLFNVPYSASAKDLGQQSIIPYNINNSYTKTGIEIIGINAQCTACLQSYKSCQLTIKMELQKKKSGVYETIKTWSAGKTGTALSVSEKRAINLLSDYRLKTTFTAGSENKVAYAYPN